MGLLSGRSRHTSSRKLKSYESSISSRRRERKDDIDEVEVKKPDLDELRRRRTHYYTATPAERRRISSGSTLKSKSARSKSTAFRSSSDRHGHRRRKHTSRSSGLEDRRSDVSRRKFDGHTCRSSKPERRNSENERRTEEYVYASRPSAERRKSSSDARKDETERSRSERRTSERDFKTDDSERPSPGRRSSISEVRKDENEQPRSVRRRSTSDRTEGEDQRPKYDRRSSRYTSSMRRQKLPTVLESELSPEDSISQVGQQERSPIRKQQEYVRPMLKRSSTTSSKLTPTPKTRDDTATVASKKGSKRGSLTSSSHTRRHSTTSVPTTPSFVECLTCGSDDIPAIKAAKLKCGHRMCHDCLKRIFDMSVKDPAHMPPKCCTAEHIPLKHVDKLFDDKFKTLWNRKYQEYTAKDKIYCPTLRCGEWIKPSHVHTVQGRKYALCPRCKTKVCVLCNNKMHKSTDCPKDPEIAKLVEQAKEEGWQRCYSCSALVERKEGCNHMTCRCMAEFCIVCGSKWKTCDCPWFNYTHLPDADRLNHMRVPEPIQAIFRQAFGGQVPPAPAPPPAPPVIVGEPVPFLRPGQPTGARGGPFPEVTYQREVDERRRQERLDEAFARRLQLASLLDGDDGDGPRQQVDQEAFGLGNVAGHFMNDNFVRNAANVVMGAFEDTNFGRRGERQAGRRRRARQAEQNAGEPGLVPDFLGDESVLGRN